MHALPHGSPHLLAAYRHGLEVGKQIAQTEGLPLGEVLRQAREGGPLWRHRDMPRVAEALQAQEELVLANRSLVGYWLARLRVPEELAQDLEAAGLMGLLRALESFRPSQGAFSTYASLWIRQAISREWERLKPKAHSLAEPLPEGEGLELGDVLPDLGPGPEERALRLVEGEVLRRKLAEARAQGLLGEREERALALELGVAPEGGVHGVHELAKALGTNPRTAKALLERGREALREAWGTMFP